MDKKSKFFKNVLLVQFVPVILIGIMILLNFRNQKLINIRGLHPFEFNYAHALPVIFFSISILVSTLTIILKSQNVTENEFDDQKKIRQQNFWKFAFYCNVFFILVITVFSVSLFRLDPLIINKPVLFYSLVFTRSLLVVVLSLVVASFLLATGVYWRANRTMGIIILFFAIVIFCASIVYEFAFMYVFVESSERYVYERNEKRVSSDKSEYYVQESQNDEETDPELEKSKLISSWNSLIKDWGKFDGTYEFSNNRVNIGQSLDDHIVENDYYYFIEYIDRLRENPDELYAGFERYKSVFYNLVSSKTYHDGILHKIVDGLLLTYDDLGQEDDKLNKIYKLMDESDKKSQHTAEDYFSDLEHYFSQETMQELKNYKLSSYGDDSGNIVWFYSFWARRNHEGNAKEVAIILNEIKEHYNKIQE